MELSLSKPFPTFPTIPNFIPKFSTLRLFCCSTSNQNKRLSSESQKKSVAVATGELFVGVASRLLRTTHKRSSAELIDGASYDDDKIAAVIEDEIEPGVMWEQRSKDVEEEKGRMIVTSPGFSFSAAGLLFPYHLGVARFLLEKGYIKETTPLAGSSAGAVVCAVIFSGYSMQEALEATKVLAHDCRLRGTAFRLGAVLRDVLDKFLPDDIHTRCNGRVRVAVTQILWRPRGLMVDQFDSKKDLINAVFTSSFIPGQIYYAPSSFLEFIALGRQYLTNRINKCRYLAPRPVTVFRNRLCIDGGLTLFMPPTSAAKTGNPEELFNWALEPAGDEVLDRLFEEGYADAVIWDQQNLVEKLFSDDASLVEKSCGG